ncbi:MAG TPA: HAD-IA family hydrolase [Immundisolibacter sp.]|nr:HAD-IA family hydrolase [Immundisolibacter sp.]
MSAPSRAALFDLDGTLLDSIPAFLAITRRACRELGWPQPAPGYIREVMTLGRSPIEALLGPVADADARHRALSAASQNLWKEVFAAEARLFHDTLSVLQRLAATGWRLGIVTDSNHFVVSRLTEAPGCPPIDVIVTRDEAPARKPSPSGIELALQMLGLAPEAAIYVGDNPIDIKAAHGAGVRAFGITTGASRREDLLPHNPYAVLDSLTQLHAHLAETAPAPVASATVRGELLSGLGEASGFLAISWVREAIEAQLGSPFYPGTVNLAADPDGAALAARLRHDMRLKRFELAARDGFCPALLHAVELTHRAMRTPALLLWPQVPGYPDDKLELICPIPLRTGWALTDGAVLDVRYLTLEEPWP